MTEPPQLTPEDIAWVQKTREGQRAIGLVLGYAKSAGLWIAAVIGALVALLNLGPWFKGH